MDLESRIDLISQVGEEILTIEELRALLETKSKPVAYDGFEPSGQLHIAQGTFRAINVNKMLDAGIHFKFWVADWFGWMNNKIGGDLEKIRKVGEYQIEVWKACGMQTDKIEFLWASDAMNDKEYWKKVVNIARNSTVKRILRCSQIMGRSESEELSAAQIFYPCMQCADVFHLKADITQLGMDQRKVNVLAREVGPKLGFWKPVVVSNKMLMGLKPPKSDITDPVERAIAMKMSKSVPDSAIWMTDSEEDIKRKISKAYCPEKQSAENPIMEYAKFLVFEKFGKLEVKRPAKFGGDLAFNSYVELENDYLAGKLHPMDLKNAVAESINEMLKPVRQHFEKNAKAKKLLEEVISFPTTR
ncbi:MAG: tyrosine--tRNA ligase [Candidatus Diapherotrites archaeon]|nr:tyrosine--tRNA ligase [Candidatus Diapherotrites archaeon]